MGGRGSGSSFTVDTDQINDLKAIAKDLEYANLAYTDSTGKFRTIRVGGTGGGTYTGAFDRRTDELMRFASNVGVSRLEAMRSDVSRRYEEQTAKARVFSGTKGKRAATLAVKQEAELKSIEQAIRIARRKGIASDIF